MGSVYDLYKLSCPDIVQTIKNDIIKVKLAQLCVKYSYIKLFARGSARGYPIADPLARPKSHLIFTPLFR